LSEPTTATEPTTANAARAAAEAADTAPQPPAPPAKERTDWRAVKMLLPYLWEYRWRVFFSVLLLILAKVANVGVPLALKEIVDSFKPDQTVYLLPAIPLVIYALLRLSTTVFAEIRDIVFVRVSQRAIRRVSLEVFQHLHSLSLRFHLARQTGGVARDIERGTTGIHDLLYNMLFTILPVLVEFALVAGILFAKFDWRFAAITFVSVTIYLTFTFLVTEWRLKIRRKMNELDSYANTRAVDSLINYETVKYFNNERFEAGRYEVSLKEYEIAAVKNERSLAYLYMGQSRARRGRSHAVGR
jgi:ATP-binding cassette, subfamily B, heavy metal transporter